RSSGFFLIDRRVILDAMVWRHPGAAISDPRHAAGSINMAVVRRLSAHVIKLRDMPEGVLEEPHLDVRSTLQWLPFYCTPPVAANVVILKPTPEDLAAGTPSSKILAKAEASQKQKASTSGVASSYVAKRTRSSLAQSSGSTTQPSVFADSRGKGIMVDDAVVPSGGVSRQRPSSEPTPSFRDVSGDDIHTDFFPFSASPYYATYPEDGVAGNCEFTREEWDAPYRPTFEVLTKEVSGLNDKLATSDASFSKFKAKEKERKKKIKFLSKSLDNLHSEVARLFAALNHATILEAERDEEILRLKATPPEFSSFLRGQFQGLIRKFLASDEFSRVQGELLSLAASAGFKRGLSMHRTKDEFAPMLKKMLEPKKLVRPANVPIPRDTRVSPPIAKESIVTPVSKSLQLSANVVPASSAVALEQNEQHVSTAVDGLNLKMIDGATHSKSGGVFVQGTSHALDDVAEVAVEGSERVSSSLTDVVVALSAGEKGDGSVPSSTVEKFSFAPSALLVALPFLLLLVSSTDGLVLISTDTFWLRNSNFIVASLVNTSAFRASSASFVQLDSFAFSILVRASRMGCFSSASFGMNLLMVVSYRNKLRIWFGLLGVRLRMIAYILPGSALSPSSVTIWPINLPSFTPNEDMVGSTLMFTLFNFLSVSLTS
nr:hypothetical protein [Tanacetum cinerariifolium]